MPSDTTVLIVRHAEKPDSGKELSASGQARAHAYVSYFQNYSFGGKTLAVDHIFAAADSPESHRPRLTMEPLAKALGLKINNKHKDADFQKVADAILKKSKYDGKTIVICWHHGEILDLTKALGADRSKLPPAISWPPSPWPSEVFGWLLQLRYDPKGDLMTTQALCVNQQLMYEDHGKDPPENQP
jgi:hypothetical protein